MSVACVLIVSEKRIPLVKSTVLPSVQGRGFAEIVWVGDGEPGNDYRFLHVPKMTGTTTDALVKRDVGTLATTSEWIFYLCDDHELVGADWEPLAHAMFDVLVPWRCTEHPTQGDVWLNMGMSPTDPNRPYCGGHAGVFRRSLIQQRPWSAMPHDRLWDLHASRIQMGMGATFTDSASVIVRDLEPENMPWR